MASKPIYFHTGPIYQEDTFGRRIETGQEWAEVCFVPNWVGHSKKKSTLSLSSNSGTHGCANGR
jgi:hypothetical protein